ncbi:MAG: SCO family protein, partial [Flavobacteriia bacterium]|nr:SCO family protein [Flavobacteriia bacterium]
LANQGFNIFASVNPEVAGGFEHQGYFALIDKQGFIRSRLDAFGNPKVYYSGINETNPDGTDDMDLLIEDIKRLLNETP